MAQQKRMLLPMQEMQFPSLEQKGLLEKEMLTHSSKEIPWRGAGRLQSMGWQRVEQDFVTKSNNILFAAADHFHSYLTCSG